MQDASRRHARSIKAVFVLFFAEAAAFGAWLPRLAEIKRGAGLSEGEMGLLLAALPVGSLLGMATVATLFRRCTVRFCAILTLTWMMAAILILGLVQTPVALAFTFFAIGLGAGSVGVAMNAAASRVEVESGRRILSTSHALFSSGLAVGGLVGGAAAELGLSLFTQGLAIQSVLAVFCLLTLGALPTDADHRQAGGQCPVDSEAAVGRQSGSRRSALVPFGLVALIAFLSEGAGLDWSAIYLTTHLAAEPLVAGAGVTALAGAMAVVRFTGDYLSVKLGDGSLLGIGIGVAAVGYAALAAAPTPAWAIAALIAIGAGLAPIAPVIFRIVGTGGSTVQAGRDIALVSGIAYTGFLAGPPLIGLTAEAFGMPASFFIVAVGLVGSGAISWEAWRRHRAPQGRLR